MSIISNLNNSLDLVVDEVEAKAGHIEAAWLNVVRMLRGVCWNLGAVCVGFLILGAGMTYAPHAFAGILACACLLGAAWVIRNFVATWISFCVGATALGSIVFLALVAVGYACTGSTALAGLAIVVGSCACCWLILSATTLVYKVSYPLTGSRLRKAQVDAL